MNLPVSILLFLIVTLGTATCVYKSHVGNASVAVSSVLDSGQSAVYTNHNNTTIIASLLSHMMMNIYPSTTLSIYRIFRTFLNVYENHWSREKFDFFIAANTVKQHNARIIMRASSIINFPISRLINAATT